MLTVLGRILGTLACVMLAGLSLGGLLVLILGLFV
jgi:hypothetical protein